MCIDKHAFGVRPLDWRRNRYRIPAPSAILQPSASMGDRSRKCGLSRPRKSTGCCAIRASHSCWTIGQKREILMFHILNRVVTGMCSLPIATAVLISLFAPSALGADPQSSGPATEKMTASAAASMDKLPYPAEVSLIHRRTGWLFRASPSNLRLYAYDADSPGKSVCNGACSTAWPPLISPAGATPLGDWTSVVRDDGRSQWAYKGHPAYTRQHDSLHPPAGDGIDGAWHFLEP